MKATKIKRTLKAVNLISMGVSILFAVVVFNIMYLQNRMIYNLKKMRKTEKIALTNILKIQKYKLQTIKRKLQPEKQSAEKEKNIEFSILNQDITNQRWNQTDYMKLLSKEMHGKHK